MLLYLMSSRKHPSCVGWVPTVTSPPADAELEPALSRLVLSSTAQVILRQPPPLTTSDRDPLRDPYINLLIDPLFPRILAGFIFYYFRLFSFLLLISYQFVPASL
ncbi:hypothetical protein KEM48_008989 [Puccinia striiformis f. sp. tritici PST-130]|nr:hypothetical protein KEM48_008989 [Puccinia striiformis f. sp. tritici PST-130]